MAGRLDLIDIDSERQLSLKQGENYSLRIQFFQQNGNPYNFTDAVGVAQLKREYSDPEPAASFTVTFDADRTNGWITLSMLGSVLAGLVVGRYVWDLFIVFTGDVPWAPLEGIAVVRPKVSDVPD